MIPQFSIAIFGPHTNHYYQDAFRGIAAYCRKFGSYQFFLSEGGEVDWGQTHELGRIDGVIAYGPLGDVLAGPSPWADTTPIVSIEQAGATDMPWRVLPDNTIVGRLVAEEFLRRAFRNLAYCPIYDEPWDLERREAFFQVARQGGVQPILCPHRCSENWAHFPRDWQGPLADWLASLPKPVAIMGASDLRARHMLLAASAARLKVPEEVAVVGVDNFSWGELCPAALSSVELDGRRAGYDSAQMLHQLMERQTPEISTVRIPPRRLIIRQSANALAIADPDVISAIHFIAHRATSGIDVEQVVDAVPVSRRVLERRFQKLLHCSIHDKIRAVQIERAKIVLTGEHIPMERIARVCGFESAKALGQAFRRVTGISPTTYRRTATGAGSDIEPAAGGIGG